MSTFSTVVMILFLLSELLGSIPKFKANGVFQLCVTILQALMMVLKPSVPGAPKQSLKSVFLHDK